MRSRVILSIVAVAALVGSMLAMAANNKEHLNPMVSLLQQHKAVFGVYLPAANALPGAPARGANGRGGGNRNAPSDNPPKQEDPCGDAAELVKNPPTVPTLTAEQIQQQAALAKLALTHPEVDYLFSGAFEEGVDVPMPAFKEMMKGLSANGVLMKSPSPHLMPVMAKAPKVGCDPKKAIDNISRELNLGFSGLMFPHTASAQELQSALAAMRFKSKGGTRSDDTGSAPAYWGMTAQQYKDKADLYTLNGNGELVNFVIIEDKDGLAHRREIAQVKGIGVLWPGAGTLHSVFYKKDANGKYIFDADGWENAIQQIADTCKEFKIPCGYPASTVEDMNKRMAQGYTVFVSGWGTPGFEAIDAGRKAANRTAATAKK